MQKRWPSQNSILVLCFFIYHMHDNRSVCISAALYVKGGLCLFLTYLAFPRHFSIYTSKSSCKIRVFKKTFIFCLCFKEVGYQGIIFSLSQVHFIFSPCLPRIFERAHDESIGKPFALELLQFFTPYDQKGVQKFSRKSMHIDMSAFISHMRCSKSIPNACTSYVKEHTHKVVWCPKNCNLKQVSTAQSSQPPFV